MRPESNRDPRHLVIQLARLGDVVQTLPALDALRQAHPHRGLDLLCAAPLAAVAAGSGLCDRVLPWDGPRWHAWATGWADNAVDTLREAEDYIASLGVLSYGRVYPLNQHARSRLLAQFCADPMRRVSDTEAWEEQMRPWAQYLRQVARDRGKNRIHLADAWCGMCGVKPRGRAPIYDQSTGDIPSHVAAIGEREGLWVALAVGAGETDRCVPTAIWSRWIQTFLSRRDDGHVVLIGGGQEREAGQSVLEGLPALLQGHVWDCTGRTTLTQLMEVLRRCHWIVGADTGPLHLGTLVGARALGFYFSRARVHETGPYGTGHWVYQSATTQQPNTWPIAESIALMCDDQQASSDDWTLWRSHMDEWGVCFDDESASQASEATRAAIWQSLAPALCRSAAA